MKQAESSREPDSSIASCVLGQNPRPKRRADVTARLVENETVVLDRANRLIHQFNITASFIWDQCDGEHTLQEIAEQLTHRFDVGLSTAERDVSLTIARFYEFHILQEDEIYLRK